MALSVPILKLECQFFGRCRFLIIGDFHLLLPRSMWALFRVPTVVTQVQNWAITAVSLPILPILKLVSHFFGRCRFLIIGNFHLLLPKSIWALFLVPTAAAEVQNWAIMAVSLPILPIWKLGSHFFVRCRFLSIGTFHILLSKSYWVLFRVHTPLI